MPVTSLEAVAGNWSRDLGGDRSTGRLPCPVQGLSSSPSSHTGIVSDIPGRLSSGSSLAARGRGDACQRSLRNRPRSGSRLLQSSLPGGEGDWRLEACDRSLSFERLRPAHAVQDGSSRFGAVICQREGFSSFLGSEGCVLSDPDPLIIEEAVEVHVGGDSLPVQSPVLRAVDCSPGLYQSLRGGVGLGSRSRDSTAPLPGRLVGSLLLGEEGQGVDQGAPLNLSHPRDCDKREEVGSRALAVCEVSRYDHRYRCRQGLPVSSKSREVPYGSGEILYHAISPSSALAGGLGPPGFAGAVGSSRSTSDALIAVASEVPVVPRVRPSSLPVALPEEARRDLSWWMVRDHLLVGVRFGTPAPDLHLYSDASSSGRGAHLLDQNVSGVWSAQEKLLHINLLELKALFLALQAFQEDVAGHHVTAMCDNSTVVAYVNKQGGTVSRPLCLLTSRLPEMDGVFRRPSRSEVSSRRVQRPGRCTQPSRASCGDRVVSPPSGGESTSSCVGQSVDRPVRDLPQREAAPVLLACPGSTGRLRGCVSSSLGRPGPLRVPSLCSGRSGDRSLPTVIASRDDSGRTSLAREGVVRRLAASTDPTTPGSTLLGQAASAAPLQPVPSRRPRAEPSRVATLKRHYRKSGLFGKGCSSLVRGPQRISLSLVPVEMEDLLWLVSWKERCSSQRLCTCSRGLSDPLTPGQGLVRLRC